MTYGTDLAYPDPMRGAEQTFVNQNPSEHQSGLTKREYFAAMAMQGYISAGSMGMPDVGNIVKYSVIASDKLIEELNKPIKG